MSSALTTDNDYLKLADYGSTTITAIASTDSDFTYPASVHSNGSYLGVQTVNHSLGVVPLVRAYWDPAKNGTWRAVEDNLNYVGTETTLGVAASTSNVKLGIMANSGVTSIPVYYKIYQIGDVGFSTDYEQDKVFLQGSGSVTVSASGSSATYNSQTVNVAHGAGEVPCWSLEFSEDNSNWYPEGTFIVGAIDTASGPPGGPYTRNFQTFAHSTCTSTTYTINLYSNYSASKTLYYRYALDYRQ